MKQHLSFEEVIRLEEDCRRMRSAAIFDAFASPFRGSKKMILSLFADGRKTYGRFERNGMAIR